MLKKLLMMSLAAFALAACNDEADEGVQYATSNPSIVDGVFTSDNMHFYGTAKVTDSEGNVFTDPEAWFEFAGDRETLAMPEGHVRLIETVAAANPNTVVVLFGGGAVETLITHLIREILPEKICRVTIEKDLEKGFDYRKITLEGFEEWEA